MYVRELSMRRGTDEEMQEESYGVTNRQRHWETYSRGMGDIARKSPGIRRVTRGYV